MLERVLENKTLRRAADGLAPGETARLTGVWGSSGALIAATLGRIRRAPVLYVAPHLDDADDVADDMEVFSGSPVHLFPAWEQDLSFGQAGVGANHVNDEVVGERMRLCSLLRELSGERDEPVDLLVAPVMALLQPVPTPEALEQAKLTLPRGGELGPEALCEWLVEAGFERTDQVDQQGEFARRGGIVDVFCAGTTQAVRVEFFGDFIDSIRRFDLDTQRSTEQIDRFDLTSTTAGFPTSSDRATSLLDYLPAETIICMHEPAEMFDLAQELHGRIHDELDGPGGQGVLNRPEDVFEAMKGFATVSTFTFSGKDRREATSLGIRSLERLSVNTREALAELEELADVAEVWVYCENPAEKARFGEVLASSHPGLAGRVRTAIGHVSVGFHWPAQKLVVVGHHELFHRYAKVRRIRRIRAGRPIESMLDLSEGDYVVHVAYGIARFEGLRRLQRNGRTEEFLSLRFADRAVLHVPARQIDLVQKYVGARGKRPSLSKLSGTTWSRQKTRVQEAVRDMAAEMLQVQAMRQAMEGVSFPTGTDWQRRFADEFLYTETEDQIAAMRQIDADMSAPRPMDRLLCGDVGYGKTELAMRAAFRVAEAGRQVAVLVPTTVLADQHYRTFTERFADYPMEVEVLSRFRKPSEQADIVKRLGLGQIDIVIGTHRLLSGDVLFADLGLVVIDEEQRFGVEHKERFKRMRATVDVLTMTATPIPRTLHMALLGLRDISSLATPPLDRRAIATRVCHYDDRLVRQSILRELNRRGQAFFVHNRVFDIDSLADHVAKLLPEAQVAVAHGQMHGDELEKTMLSFVRHEIDVLVCTTIIESGLDIPTANTMIIHDADRFGLSELHQLRGRVGRYKHRAYCYLLLPESRSLSPTAAKRLKAVEEFSDLGAGFQIAMRDLEIRGAGNILGREQSGHIAAVGYELYCRLLERSVRELKGEPVPQRPDVHVELGIDAYIPRSFIPSQRQRMEVYRRMVRCEGRDELEQLRADLDDAYGAAPPMVQTLLDVAESRLLAGSLGVRSIIRMDPDLIFSVRDFAGARRLFDGVAGTVRLPDDKTVHWRPPANYLEIPTLLNVLLKQLRLAAPSV